jgi:beta-N-acetylhexosaminidase
MAGHISCPNAAGDDTPASLSRFLLTDVLREQLQFTGVIVTDAMNMEAITSRYTDGEAAVQAITAGADLILMPNDLEAAASAIRAAVEDGTLTEERLNESVYRILRLKMDYQIISGDGTAAEGERAA